MGSCQKVLPRRNIIIEAANKIINKQGKGIMLDFFFKSQWFMLVNGGDKQAHHVYFIVATK